MDKVYDISSVCNALVDIVLRAKDEDLDTLNLCKGQMRLVDETTQRRLLNHFRSQEQVIELGGSALNTIRTIAKLGTKTMFAGMIANDMFGSRIKEKLEQLDIDSLLSISPDESTGSCVVLVTPDGERTLNTYLGASRLYDRQAIPTEKIAASKVFHFCGYQWDTPGQKDGIQYAIKVAKESNCIISFDLSDPFVVEKNKEDFRNIVEKDADIVFANRDEAHTLYQLSPKETAEKIAKYQTIAAIKLDSEGALIQTESSSFVIPPIETNVVDTTGAGDMFAAGFILGYLASLPLEQCGKIASTLASDVISRMGVESSDQALEKVRGLLKIKAS